MFARLWRGDRADNWQSTGGVLSNSLFEKPQTPLFAEVKNL